MSFPLATEACWRCFVCGFLWYIHRQQGGAPSGPPPRFWPTGWSLSGLAPLPPPLANARSGGRRRLGLTQAGRGHRMAVTWHLASTWSATRTGNAPTSLSSPICASSRSLSPSLARSSSCTQWTPLPQSVWAHRDCYVRPSFRLIPSSLASSPSTSRARSTDAVSLTMAATPRQRKAARWRAPGSRGRLVSSPPFASFSSALASPKPHKSFPPSSLRSTRWRWPDHGEQRRRVRHARWRASSRARRASDLAPMCSPQREESTDGSVSLEDPPLARSLHRDPSSQWGRWEVGPRAHF